MNLHIVVLQISFLLIFTNMGTLSFVVQTKRDCVTMWMNKLMKIGCNDMNLKEVPQKLTSSVRVLDLSYNRIKKLKTTSFESYSKLKYLILYENMIQSVETDTFSHLTSLEEIDLSNNALTTVPLEIFQLPSLRNLYVDSNDLINFSANLESLSKPIGAPLEYLNIADCGLHDIPDLGILPRLIHINASLNPLELVSVNRFASMCHLKSVDLTKTSMPTCACQQIDSYLLFLGVITSFRIDCDEDEIDLSTCPDMLNATTHSDAYQNCSTAPIKAKFYSNWMFMAGCALGVAIVLIVLVCILRNRRKTKRAKKKKISNRTLLYHSNNNDGQTNPNSDLISPEPKMSGPRSEI